MYIGNKVKWFCCIIKPFTANVNDRSFVINLLSKCQVRRWEGKCQVRGYWLQLDTRAYYPLYSAVKTVDQKSD